MKRKLITTLVSLSAVVGAGLTIAPTASAADASPAKVKAAAVASPDIANGAYGCAGNLINAAYLVKNQAGVTISDIYVYWDASTERNCAVNVRTAAGGYGTYKGHLNVQIADNDTFWDDSDPGNYAQYAGPVSVYSPGCIWVNAETQDPSNGIINVRTVGPIGCS